MNRLLGLIGRWMPLLFLVVVCVSLAQFFLQHPAHISEFPENLHHVLARGHALWPVFLAAAAIAWLVVFAGWRHEKRGQRGPGRVRDAVWAGDVLDRLTNRRTLEDRLKTAAKPQFIDATRLAEAMKRCVIGQDTVCDEVAAQIRRRLALGQRLKPVGIFLFAGPPGTGKSYLAKVLARELRRPLVHLDMTQFARGGAASTQLFGSTKGYVGSDTYGKLTAALRDSPTSVILLDEFEKAHPEVHKNFLTAWNDGFITEGSDGKAISTVQSIFVLTTNAAIEPLAQIVAKHRDSPDEIRRLGTQALIESGFAPELLNRIDRLFLFSPLVGLDVARVAALELEQLVQSYGLGIAPGGIASSVLASIVARHALNGNAASSRDIVRLIEEQVADSLIEAKRKGALIVNLDEEMGRVVASPARGDLVSYSNDNLSTRAGGLE